MGVDMLKSYIPACTVTHSSLSVSVNFDGHLVSSDTADLRLIGQNIVDISGIQQLGELRSVDLSANMISNLYPLIFADCRRTITSLNLSYNGLSDLTPLSMLTCIESLDLSYNRISSLQPLMTLTTLRSLRLSGNPLSMQDINTLCFALPDCEVIF
jgi:Leucine Rich Repeat.